MSGGVRGGIIFPLLDYLPRLTGGKGHFGVGSIMLYDGHHDKK